MREVRNLDLLRPKESFVTLAGKKVDLSFLPVGIVFDVNEVINELAKLEVTEKKVTADDGMARKAFDLTIRLCALVTSCQNEEMTEAWLKKRLSVRQLEALAEEIRNLMTAEIEQMPEPKAEGEKKTGARPG